MAKGCNAIGGSFRGRVGNATYYVRHGKLIVYERVPRQEHRHVERHPGSDASMKYAQRWRKQLADEGVVIELAPLLEFYHSIVKVADGDPGEWLADSGSGGWSAGNVSVVDGQVRARAKARDQAQWRDGYLVWGGSRIEGSSLPTNCFWDIKRNVYPSGSLFCSVVGSIEEEMVLVIGRRVDVTSTYKIQTRAYIGKAIAAAYDDGSTVKTIWGKNAPSPLPEPHDYIYRVIGWRAPGVVGLAAVARPFFIVNADGVVLEMGVLS